jgi:hypothetical protein
MGIRINVSKTYKTPVKYTVLLPEGKPEPQSFVAEFTRLNREQVQEMVESKAKDSEMVRQVLVGWNMKNIDTGESIDFTKDTLEECLKIPGWAGVTIMVFFDTVGANREKN